MNPMMKLTHYILKPALLLILSISAPVDAETLVGRVIRIEDGGTVTILDAGNRQQTIRLVGIAAPDRLQSFGARAQANLGSLISGQEVAVIWGMRTREGDILGKVIVSPPEAACRQRLECQKTLDAGLQQVADGMAWWHLQNIQDQAATDRAAYQHAEFDAKIHRRGLWADTNPIPPWKWPRSN